VTVVNGRMKFWGVIHHTHELPADLPSQHRVSAAIFS
jgi:hypothetical protein